MNQMEIADLFKGAYFLTRSCQVKEVRLNGSNQVRFVIAGDNLDMEEQLYQTGQARVNPLQLKECLNFLRDKLNQTLGRKKAEAKAEAKEVLTKGYDMQRSTNVSPKKENHEPRTLNPKSRKHHVEEKRR